MENLIKIVPGTHVNVPLQFCDASGNGQNLSTLTGWAVVIADAKKQDLFKFAYPNNQSGFENLIVTSSASGEFQIVLTPDMTKTLKDKQILYLEMKFKNTASQWLNSSGLFPFAKVDTGSLTGKTF